VPYRNDHIDGDARCSDARREADDQQHATEIAFIHVTACGTFGPPGKMNATRQIENPYCCPRSEQERNRWLRFCGLLQFFLMFDDSISRLARLSEGTHLASVRNLRATSLSRGNEVFQRE
jgi:hypothetical protein